MLVPVTQMFDRATYMRLARQLANGVAKRDKKPRPKDEQIWANTYYSVWKSNFRRPTLRSCVCSMAWRLTKVHLRTGKTCAARRGRSTRPNGLRIEKETTLMEVRWPRVASMA